MLDNIEVLSMLLFFITM